MRNFRFGRVLVATALSLTFMLPAVRAAEPKDLLKHIPDDAWGFVILKSLENTDKKLRSSLVTSRKHHDTTQKQEEKNQLLDSYFHPPNPQSGLGNFPLFCNPCCSFKKAERVF